MEKIVQYSIAVLINYLFIIINTSCYSQKYDLNYVVGYDFHVPTDTPKSGYSLLNFENKFSINYLPYGLGIDGGSFTSSNMCDRNGDFIYYYNSAALFNREFKLMKNGDSLNYSDVWGHNYYPIVNAAMSIPHPKDDNKYYFFHKGVEVGTWGSNIFYLYCNVMYYSMVDMNGDGGMGEVILKNQVLIRDTIVESHTTACRHANGRDWWIPVRTCYKGKYYMLLLTPDGISIDHIQYIGQDGPSLDYGFPGNACFSRDGSKYASALVTMGLQIMDFDRCTGYFSNPVIIKHDTLYTNANVCFSANGRYVYFNDVLNLWQYDLKSPDLKKSEVLVGVWDTFYLFDKFGTGLFNMRLMPDDKIYISMAGGSGIHLHRVNSPDQKGKACNFVLRDIELPNWHYGSLPQFPNYRLGALKGSDCDTLNSLVDNHKFNFECEVEYIDNVLFINFDEDFQYGSEYLIEIYNLEGKLVYNEVFHLITSRKKIVLSELFSGFFTYSLKGNGKILKTGKFIKYY